MPLSFSLPRVTHARALARENQSRRAPLSRVDTHRQTHIHYKRGIRWRRRWWSTYSASRRLGVREASLTIPRSSSHAAAVARAHRSRCRVGKERRLHGPPPPHRAKLSPLPILPPPPPPPPLLTLLSICVMSPPPLLIIIYTCVFTHSLEAAVLMCTTSSLLRTLSRSRATYICRVHTYAHSARARARARDPQARKKDGGERATVGGNGGALRRSPWWKPASAAKNKAPSCCSQLCRERAPPSHCCCRCLVFCLVFVSRVVAAARSSSSSSSSTSLWLALRHRRRRSYTHARLLTRLVALVATSSSSYGVTARAHGGLSHDHVAATDAVSVVLHSRRLWGGACICVEYNKKKLTFSYHFPHG